MWIFGTRQGYLAVGHEETWEVKARIELRGHEEEDEMEECSKGYFYLGKTGWKRGLGVI